MTFGPPMPAALVLDEWPPPSGEAHHVRSVYAETFWLPIIGPTALWMARRFGSMLDAGGPVKVDSIELALSLGLPGKLDGHRSITRTFRRLIEFGWVREDPTSADYFQARRLVTPLDRAALGRLTPALRQAHRQQWEI